MIMKNRKYLKIIIIIAVIAIIAAIGIIAVLFLNEKKIPDSTPLINKSQEDNLTPPIETNNTDNPVIEPSKIASVSGNYSISMKFRNPQYKEGSEMFIIYEIENKDNSTLNIPKNIVNGLIIKNNIGNPTNTYESSDKLVILKDDIEILPLQKTTSEFSIKSSDFNIVSSSSGEGSFTFNLYIGDVKSNKVIVRVLR